MGKRLVNNVPTTTDNLSNHCLQCKTRCVKIAMKSTTPKEQKARQRTRNSQKPGVFFLSQT